MPRDFKNLSKFVTHYDIQVIFHVASVGKIKAPVMLMSWVRKPQSTPFSTTFFWQLLNLVAQL